MTSPTGLFIANALVNLGIVAVMAVGLNVTFGMAGILDLAYIAFVAFGAYIGGVIALGPSNAALQLNHILGLSLPWPVSIIGGGIAAALLGFIVGLVALRRLRSDYLAIVMVAFWSIFFDIATNALGLFNGPIGLFNVPQPLSSLTSPLYYAWVFLPIVAVILLALVTVAYRLERSAFGRTVRAVRDDGDLAEAFGKPITAVRMRALVIGCAYAGVAGALTCLYITSYNPSAWMIFETIGTFAAVLLGGRGNVFGALFGAFVISAVVDGVQFIPTIGGRTDLTVDLREFVFAALIAAVLLIRPHGVFRERFGVRALEKAQSEHGATTAAQDPVQAGHQSSDRKGF